MDPLKPMYLDDPTGINARSYFVPTCNGQIRTVVREVDETDAAFDARCAEAYEIPYYPMLEGIMGWDADRRNKAARETSRSMTKGR